MKIVYKIRIKDPKKHRFRSQKIYHEQNVIVSGMGMDNCEKAINEFAERINKKCLEKYGSTELTITMTYNGAEI